MKKSFILFAASLLALAGCSRNQEIDVPDANLSLFARTESPADTKTVVESGVHVYWEPGDEIAVFMGEKSAKFTTDITASSATATFKGTFGDTTWPEDLDLWAVYPFSEDAVFDGETITTVLPSEQIAREGSFGKDMNLAVAHSNSSTLQFYNVGGGIRFSVTEEGIKKVMFEGLSGEIISGKVKIGFENGLPIVKEVTGGSQFITLLPPSGKEAFEKDAWYYIVAIPGSLEGGYKLRFYKDSDYARKVSEQAVTIKRSIYGSIDKADSGIEYEAQTTHFPETIEEIRESEQKSLELCDQVDDVFRGAGFYDVNAEELDIQAITSSIRQIEGVLSVHLEEAQKMITVMKKDSTIIHFDYDDYSYYEDNTETETECLYSEIVEMARSQSSDQSGSTTKKALLLSPFQNSFWVKGQQMGNFHVNETEIQDLLRPLGYSLKFLKDDEASLDKFTLDYLADYDLVMIISHGGGVDDLWYGTTVITGSYYFTTENKPELYWLSEQYVTIGGIPRYGINPRWLELTYGETKRFNNSIIYMGSCHSYDIDDMKDVFLQHGASAYYGFEGETPYGKNGVSVTGDLLISVVRSLCQGMDVDKARDFTLIDNDLWTTAFKYSIYLWYGWPWNWSFDYFKVNPEAKQSPVFLVDPRPKELHASVDGNIAKLSWKCDYALDACEYLVHTDGRNFSFDPSLNQSVSVPFDKPGTYQWSIVTNVYAKTTSSDEPVIVASYRTDGEPFTVKESQQYATPEAVDLGLSVKWASFNLGATKKEEYGYYFAWGETEPKDYYFWDSYKWCKGSYNTLTKYCTNSANGYNGFVDKKLILETEDDAAFVNLGEKWRMPTEDEWKELQENCTWTWTTEFGEGGYKAISKKNGNFIFFPLGGYYYTTQLIGEGGTSGDYWASCLPLGSIPDVTTSYSVYSPVFGQDKITWNFSQHRYSGLTIRPVSPTPASRVILDRTEITGYVGHDVVLDISTIPENASHSFICTSSNESVATIPLYNQTICFVECLSPGVTTVTVAAYDGGAKATCQITVKGTPMISASPTSLDYGDVKVGTALGNEAGRVTFTNTGSGDLHIDSIDCPDGFSHSSAYTFPIVISPGKDKTITFAFKPTEVKTYSGYLEIYSDAWNEYPLQVKVTGNGIK